MFDGKVPHWHHYSCFWKRARIVSHADIDGFPELRWEDQEKIKKAIETGGPGGGKYRGVLVFGDSAETKLPLQKLFLWLFVCCVPSASDAGRTVVSLHSRAGMLTIGSSTLNQ